MRNIFNYEKRRNVLLYTIRITFDLDATSSVSSQMFREVVDNCRRSYFLLNIFMRCLVCPTYNFIFTRSTSRRILIANGRIIAQNTQQKNSKQTELKKKKLQWNKNWTGDKYVTSQKRKKSLNGIYILDLHEVSWTLEEEVIFLWKFCENGEFALEKAEPHSYQIDNLMEIVSYPAKVGHKYKIL